MSVLIEAAAFTPLSAIAAAWGGADRIELCSGYAEGGLSPSIGSVAYVKEHLSIPVHVMVRPRVGDFVYNKEELQVMEREILFYKQLGINGVVFGVLTEQGNIATEAVRRLIAAARPMSVTFHRAFDQCTDLFRALDDLMDCGVNRILTSGGKPSVPEGADMLEQLIAHAGNALILLPGGGISATNVSSIIQQLNVREIHLSGKHLVKSPMQPSPHVSLCAPGEVYDFQWYECEEQRIRDVKTVCADLFA
ncbi:copper homeostasis protein CutC [Microbacter margulisiae]|uniref:PF03932 family protein CutC n=1 Tax=Microbacter margulisiae TaxID=1350067 RepID=A0A7W5DNV4_9PORP|nr:copper homeostasis protein CutC [Microbacter margulisiae]MBB3186359.1 copper homeostasis protein [Microbacter margulisiae]